MAASTSMEIRDLRHFEASAIRPLLEVEGEIWKQRLHWDYQHSSRLLMQYLDNRALPGFAAMEARQAVGYAFSVYEDSKAVIGDVFAIPNRLSTRNEVALSGHAVEQTLLRHMLELLLNSPQLDRIESQLLLHPSGTHSAFFIESGFKIYRRLFMVQQLFGRTAASPHIPPLIILPNYLQLRPWSDNDLTPAARLICASYTEHPDSLINEQYRTAGGAMRFLNNIVRYSGCGAFTAPASYVIVDRSRRELAAMILGSRVSPLSGHITQLCVHPHYRRMGLGRKLLSLASHSFAREGAQEISLTVTESNSEAIELYRSEGYTTPHLFDAAVWQRSATA